jgi:hypothetical protein
MRPQRSGTTIIAASSNPEKLSKAVEPFQRPSSEGHRQKTQTRKLELSDGTKTIAEAIRDVDRTFGPITHLYAFSGLGGLRLI